MFMEKLFLAGQYSSYTIHTEWHIKLMVKLMIIKTRVFNPWAATRTIQAIGRKSYVKLYRGTPRLA